MIRPAQLFRLAHINFVLVRHGLDDLILATHLLRPFRFLYYMAPWNWLPRERDPRAVRIRRALVDLGPIYVKFGQILSTRRDLLPDDVADELAKLQDRVPPFAGDVARSAIESSLGESVDTVFRGYSVSLRFKFPSVPSVRGGSVDQAARTARYEAPVAEILSSEKAIDWIATW